jgi:hypothetical protein
MTAEQPSTTPEDQPTKRPAIERILRLAHWHKLDDGTDLAPWRWGHDPVFGLELFWCYEEAPAPLQPGTVQMPQWLLDLCICARRDYGCEWLMFERNGHYLRDLDAKVSRLSMGLFIDAVNDSHSLTHSPPC